jgi:hypothetical protein
MNSEPQGLRERSRDLAGDGDAMGYYLNSLKKHQQLNHEQMVELFKILEEGGPTSSKVRNKLVETNLRLVVYVAKQYKRHNMPLEDIIQEGNLGLMKAIEKFDMLSKDDRILVAVSGGKDSLAVWDLLIDLGYQADGLYIGLGIGEYSDRVCQEVSCHLYGEQYH